MGDSMGSRKGFFEANEGIFLISSNYLEKQQIEDGLNREIETIRTVMDLVKAFTSLSTNDGIRASVIITSEIPPDIQRNLDEVKESIEVSGVPAFEIATGELIEGAYRFGSIMDFVKYARENKRKAKISEVKDVEQRTILQELQLETEVRQEIINGLKADIEVMETDLKELEGKYTTLQAEVEQVYKVQRDNAVRDIQEVQNNLDEMNRLYGIEREKSEQYRHEKDDALGEMTELRLNVKSLETAMYDKQNEIKKLETEIGRLRDEIDTHIREKDNILKSKVDAEDHVLLSDELKKAREEVSKMKVLLTEGEINLRKVKYEKDLIEHENHNLKAGEVSIKENGRTSKLDRYKFNKVDLIYIKVYENLPYLRLALKMFYEQVSERYSGQTHMMILRHDDGLDAKYYEGINVWSKLKDVPPEDKIFRIFPNHVMFSRTDDWEEGVDLLIVVDNIKNNEYYLESRSKERYMTVVRRETDIQKYGLKGSPIALEGNSVYDITYDPKIANSVIKGNRRGMLELKVRKWVEKILD